MIHILRLMALTNYTCKVNFINFFENSFMDAVGCYFLKVLERAKNALIYKHCQIVLYTKMFPIRI